MTCTSRHRSPFPYQLPALGISSLVVTVWGGFGPDHTAVPSTPRPLTGTYSYLLTYISRSHRRMERSHVGTVRAEDRCVLDGETRSPWAMFGVL